MSSRDTFDKKYSDSRHKEADVSFRIGLLHHVLFFFKYSGEGGEYWKDLVRISLKQANKICLWFIRK